MELSTYANYRGHRLEFTSGVFFNCDITFHDSLVGGLLASAAHTTAEEFVQQCKAAVDKLLLLPARYVGGTTEKNFLDRGRR